MGRSSVDAELTDFVAEVALDLKTGYNIDWRDLPPRWRQYTIIDHWINQLSVAESAFYICNQHQARSYTIPGITVCVGFTGASHLRIIG